MKQFFLILLVCALGYFFAPQVLGIKTKSKEQYVNAVDYSSEERELNGKFRSVRDKMVPVATVTFVLDLEKAEQVQEPARLMYIETNHKPFGLMVTKSGIVGCWEGAPWSENAGLPMASLLDNPNMIRVKGRDCLALTALVCGSVDTREKTPGITLVDSSGDVLLRYPALNSSYNEEHRRMSMHEELVTHVMIAPKLLSVRAAGKRTARLEKIVSLKPGNAMVAYGGGGVVLLILAALWPKGRRRKKADNSALKLQSLSQH